MDKDSREREIAEKIGKAVVVGVTVAKVAGAALSVVSTIYSATPKLILLGGIAVAGYVAAQAQAENQLVRPNPIRYTLPGSAKVSEDLYRSQPKSCNSPTTVEPKSILRKSRAESSPSNSGLQSDRRLSPRSRSRSRQVCWENNSDKESELTTQRSWGGLSRVGNSNAESERNRYHRAKSVTWNRKREVDGVAEGILIGIGEAETSAEVAEEPKIKSGLGIEFEQEAEAENSKNEKAEADETVKAKVKPKSEILLKAEKATEAPAGDKVKVEVEDKVTPNSISEIAAMRSEWDAKARVGKEPVNKITPQGEARRKLRNRQRKARRLSKTTTGKSTGSADSDCHIFTVRHF